MSTHPLNPGIRLIDGAWYAADTHPYYDWMRANAPVYQDPACGVWGITLHEDILAASRDPATFTSSLGMRPDSPPVPSMINMDDPDHKRRRSLVNRGFTPRRVQDHEPKVRAICRDLIARVAPTGHCDFVRDIAAPLPMIIIGDMLGVEPEDRDTLLRWSDDLIAGSAASASPELMNASTQAFIEYSDYNRAVVADRRAHPRDDLITILLNAEIDGQRMDDHDILQESLLILVGGDETTRHVITGGMAALIRNPDQRQLLIDNPSKLPVAVEEMLRWVTPIQNMARTATRDVTLRGQQLHEGDKLVLLYPSGNRDERVFDEPHQFRVERDPNPHIAFGGPGPHFCLGASLARLELRVMFEELLRAIPDMAFATPDPLPLRPSNFIVGIEHMPVAFPPHAPRSHAA